MKFSENIVPKGINSRRSYDLGNGEPPQIESQLPPELSSLSETWLAESWLLAAGVVPNSSIDTLLMYAYSQPGVQKVNIEIDKDEGDQGKSPKIYYKVKLTPSKNIKWEAYKRAEAIKSPIPRKIAMLAVAKSGAPLGIEEIIIEHAKEYLPPQYNVFVDIVDKL